MLVLVPGSQFLVYFDHVQFDSSCLSFYDHDNRPKLLVTSIFMAHFQSPLRWFHYVSLFFFEDSFSMICFLLSTFVVLYWSSLCFFFWVFLWWYHPFHDDFELCSYQKVQKVLKVLNSIYISCPFKKNLVLYKTFSSSILQSSSGYYWTWYRHQSIFNTFKPWYVYLG